MNHILAAGYKVVNAETNDQVTVFANTERKIAVTKQDQRVVIYRVFGYYKNLTTDQETRLLRAINRINATLPYQVFLRDNLLYVSVNDWGSYEKDIFSNLVKMVEMIEGLVTKNPEINELATQ